MSDKAEDTTFMDILDAPDEDAATETPPEAAPEPAPETPEPVAEAPAVEAPPAEQPAAEVVLPDGYKRDEKGRVHRPDGTIASKDEVAAFATAPAPAPPTPEAPAPEPVPATPFRYRAVGDTHEYKGASVDSGGRVVFEPDAVSTLRQQLNAAHMVPHLQRENAQLKAQAEQRGQSEVVSSKLVDALTKIIEHPDEAKAIEEFFQLRARFPELRAKAEIEYWRSQAQRGQPQEAEPQPSTMPDEEIAKKRTLGFLEDAKFEHEFRTLGDADWKQIGDELSVTPYAFVRPATAQHAQQYPGIRAGQLVFDTDAALAYVRSFAKRTAQAREAEATARKAKEAAAFNARQQAQPPTAPPTRPKGSTALATATTTPKKGDWFDGAWNAPDDEDE